MPQHFYSSTLEETQWKFLVTKKRIISFRYLNNDPSKQPRNFTGDPLANQKKLLLTEMKTILMELYPENYIDFMVTD